MGKSHLRTCFSDAVGCYWEQQSSFSVPKHTGKFLLPSSTQINQQRANYENKTISSPPRLALHWISQPNQLLPQPRKSLDAASKAAELYPFTAKQMMSFANVSALRTGAELCCSTGPVTSKWQTGALAQLSLIFLPFPWEGPQPTVRCSVAPGGQSRQQGTDPLLGSRSFTCLPAIEEAALQVSTSPVTPHHREAAFSTWEFIRHLPGLSCLLLKAFSLLLLHTRFLHFHYTADCAYTYITICFLPAFQWEAQLTADSDHQNLRRQPARNSQAHGKHRSPDVMHTSVNRKPNLFSQFNAVKGKA